jgi:hypothetical protein
MVAGVRERREKRPSISGLGGPDRLPPTVVLVNGAGPGLGKTTLTRLLADALGGRGAAVELFVEEDILRRPEFEPVIQEFRTRPRVELQTLLDASREYVAECGRRAKDFYILDALFPYWLSLEAWAYTDAEVSQFLSDLGDLADEVHWIELYLEGDLNSGLERAAEREGPGWIESQISKISGFRLVDIPPRDSHGVAAYYRRTADRRRVLRAAVPWRVEVIQADLGPEASLAQALRFLDISQAEAARR